jgi:hypothetical protein
MGARLVTTVVASTLAGAVLTSCTADRPAIWNTERDRTFALPGGQSIAIAPADAGDLLVRWRDTNGTWTAPRAAHHDDRAPLLVRARVGGPTLAAAVTYSPRDTMPDDDNPLEDLAADDVTVLVVCRANRCTSSDALAGSTGDPPQVTPDGTHVVLTSPDDGLLRWDGRRIRVEHPRGLPDEEYGAGQPLLAPDGSLRAVAGRREADGCVFTLLTAESGGATFTQAVRTTAPTDRQGSCAMPIETFSSSYVVVDARRTAAWFLSREDGRWQRVTEDPSGQVRYPRGTPRLAGRFARSGFWHWREVVASSPDGRTLVVQVHFPGQEQWSAPQVVARAPAGTQCRSIDPMPSYTWGEEDPFYVNLRCRARHASNGVWPLLFPTAVSEDGRTWHSFVGDGFAVRIGRALYFRGTPSLRWTPDDGLRQVDLTWTGEQPDLDGLADLAD